MREQNSNNNDRNSISPPKNINKDNPPSSQKKYSQAELEYLNNTEISKLTQEKKINLEKNNENQMQNKPQEQNEINIRENNDDEIRINPNSNNNLNNININEQQKQNNNNLYLNQKKNLEINTISNINNFRK